MDPDERDAFQNLCKTNGTSASAVLRGWMLAAIQQQTIELGATGSDGSGGQGSVPPEMLKELMGRMAALEKAMPKFDTDDLVRMRNEVLLGEFGSMRYRLGIVEAQLQAQGGSIAWESGPAEKQ